MKNLEPQLIIAFLHFFPSSRDVDSFESKNRL